MERDRKREPFAPILEMFDFGAMWILSFLWNCLNFIYLLYCHILASMHSTSDICIFPFCAQYFSNWHVQIPGSLRNYFWLSMSTMKMFRFSVWWYKGIGITYAGLHGCSFSVEFTFTLEQSKGQWHHNTNAKILT